MMEPDLIEPSRKAPRPSLEVVVPNGREHDACLGELVPNGRGPRHNVDENAPTPSARGPRHNHGGLEEAVRVLVVAVQAVHRCPPAPVAPVASRMCSLGSLSGDGQRLSCFESHDSVLLVLVVAEQGLARFL